MIKDEEFQRITVFMKQRYGIDLAQKKVIVNGRLENYIRRGGWHSFDEFMNAVEQDKSGNQEKMLVNFEIMTNMRDLTEMSGEFLKGLVVMGKQMAGLTAKMDFVKSEKELNKAMIEAQVQTEKMNEFLDRMTVTIDSGFEEAGGIADEEIDAVIGVDETREQRSLDEEIDLKLAELNKKLKQS